jgi:FlaG/FlaF family flagellin (archaellin)
MMKRKGVSALIATILLIVVSVALIAIILTWGKSFTNDSISQASNVIDDSCDGAQIKVSNCMIDDDNVTFFVENIGTTYTFAATDVFKIDLKDESNDYNGGLSIDDYITWAALAPGETVLVDMDIPANITGNIIDVTVRSSICTANARYTFINCH